MMLQHTLVFLVMLGSALTVLAQTEELMDSVDPDLNPEESEELEMIQWLQEHPLDLNKVSMEILRSIPGISEQDALSVLTHRARHGPFRSADQLLEVPGISKETARWVRTFMFVREVEAPGEPLRIDFRTRATRDIQVREGYRSGVYIGSPDKSYLRLSALKPRVGEAGILAEKDAGEPIRAGFLSGYIALQNLPLVSTVVLGDFHFESGEGLVFWQGSGFGKGGNPGEVGEKRPRGVSPHRSAGEFRFLRGIGATSITSFPQVDLTLSGFYSNRSLPATVDSAGTVTSFFETGIFRSESEIAKRSGVREELAGGTALAEWKNGFSCGITGYGVRFSRQIGAIHGLQGAWNGAVVGINTQWLFANGEIATESAMSSNSAVAFFLRGVRRFGRAGSLVMIYRNYSSQFLGWYSSGFGERADTRNEQGLYLGVLIRPIERVTTSFFVDNFSFHGRTSTLPVPSQGHDAGFILDAHLDSRSDLSARVTWSRGQDLRSEPGPFGWDLRSLINHDQTRFRLTFIHEPHSRLRLKSRIEGTHVPSSQDVEGEEGLMLFQDVRLNPAPGLICEARLIFFHTDSYATRIYEFENDVRGVYSSPPLFGTGKRWYLLVRYEFLPGATVSAKFSETQKEGVRVLGSGPAEIAGDKESRMTIQIDVRL